MTITTSIDRIGSLKATEMIQSARTKAAIEHKKGLHTVTMEVPGLEDAHLQATGDGRILPAPQKRVVDISV
ncbi:hypothetical protein [Methylobacterium sp. CM6257]|jgi:hypothetical protein